MASVAALRTSTATAFVKARCVLVAVIMLVTLVPGSAANQGGSTATLAGTVSDWLATSAPDGELEVIVTFRDAAAVQRLEALAGSLERLESVPMTLATADAQNAQCAAVHVDTQSGTICSRCVLV